jgi:two-component system OmpR family sensor kinase
LDLLPALRLLVEDARRGAKGAGITLKTPDGLALEGAIDLDAFGIAMRNLIENALVHGQPPFVVSVHDDVIDISNGGPPVPPGTLANLKTRFVRGETNASGSGLGLAIVDTILTQAGWTLDLRSPRPGETDGFQASIRVKP